ncbi:MAG: histidine--tRNA ligase [Clostridiales bacterium]|nr:histidine--tRNA ligase [Clostridiales bacterium]
MSTPKLSTRPLKGTRDFYPEDMRLRNWFFGKIREALELCAFEEYNGPMLEPLEIYAAKSGVELASEQTYNFTDRGGRELSIRPEMTPTVARMVAARINELTFPLRWYSVQNFYRYERPQRGRLREFWQINADIFGSDSYEADFEIISVAINLLRIFGADESMFRVHINNRRLFGDVIASVAKTDAEGVKAISKVIDRREKIERVEYENELRMLGLGDAEITKIDSLYSMSLDEIISLCPDSKGAAELGELFRTLEATGLSKYCVFDFGIIRGLDYYTGTVFEVFDLAPENNRAMFGGGRYDNLVGLFVERNDISGVGFGLGDVTLENFLRTHNLIPDLGGRTLVLVTRFDDVPYEKYTAILSNLRNAGIAAMIFFGSKKLGKQLEYASKAGCTHAIIMGAGELAGGVVKIKDLGTREEQVVEYSRIAKYFGK